MLTAEDRVAMGLMTLITLVLACLAAWHVIG